MSHTSVLYPAVFLDRDGTLNVDVGYPDSLEKIRLIPGAVEAVKLFNRLGYKVFVVSNQSGIARGFFDEARVREIHRGMQKMFARQGARIDAFYFCPHHPDIGEPPYRRQCDCRKPEPGMFLQAAEAHDIDLSRSVMIGDKAADVEAGKRLGMISVLVLTGAGPAQLEQIRNDPTLPDPDFVARDVLEAARWISRRGEHHQ